VGKHLLVVIGRPRAGRCATARGAHCPPSLERIARNAAAPDMRIGGQSVQLPLQRGSERVLGFRKPYAELGSSLRGFPLAQLGSPASR